MLVSQLPPSSNVSLRSQPPVCASPVCALPTPTSRGSSYPLGAIFTRDGRHIAVADTVNVRVSLFYASNGAFVRHLATAAEGLVDPFCLVERQEGDGLYISDCGDCALKFLPNGEDLPLAALPVHVVEAAGATGSRPVRLHGPTGLAVLPGLGLLVRERDARRCRLLVPASERGCLEEGAEAGVGTGPMVSCGVPAAV
jgi:hypothetical protein